MKIIKGFLWLYIIILLGVFTPSYTELPFETYDYSRLIPEVLSNPVIYQYWMLFFASKILILALFLCPIILKNRFKRLFSILGLIILLPVTIFQNISDQTSYGLVILFGNIFIQLVIIIAFIMEIIKPKNDFSKIKLKWWNVATMIFAFFAFWMPARNGQIYFNIIDLFTNEAGLTFCMLIPIFISIFLMYENKNIHLIKIISIIGVYYGILNQITWFLLNRDFWWIGIVHLPLLINSIIGLLVTKKIILIKQK
jgi:hypothetical protein